MIRLLPPLLTLALVAASSASAQPAAPPPQWFVPPPTSDRAVDVHGAVAARSDARQDGGVEQITVTGRRAPAIARLEIPDLPGEDMSKYRRDPDYLTRSHRAPCSASFASVGNHEDRGSSLATGLGAAGCD